MKITVVFALRRSRARRCGSSGCQVATVLVEIDMRIHVCATPV